MSTTASAERRSILLIRASPPHHQTPPTGVRWRLIVLPDMDGWP
jgi:hypothetical protein